MLDDFKQSSVEKIVWQGWWRLAVAQALWLCQREVMNEPCSTSAYFIGKHFKSIVRILYISNTLMKLMGVALAILVEGMKMVVSLDPFRVLLSVSSKIKKAARKPP